MTDFNEPPTGHEGDDVVVRAGRRASSWTDVHDWVTFSDKSPGAKALYTILRAHVNRQRGDDLVWTSKLALAKIMQRSRGDKIDPEIKELRDLGAIETERSGPKGTLLFTVNQEPPADYDGPLTVADWHGRNRDTLNAIREAEKARRAGQPSRAKKSAPKPADQREGADEQTNGGPDSVTPKSGEQAVTPDRGERVTPKPGSPVTPGSGRKPDVLEPDVEEPQNPLADATAAEASPSVQTTIDGKDEPLKNERTEAQLLKDLAAKITRWWFEGWKGVGTPIAGDTAEARMRTMVAAFLRSQYTEEEIKNACRATGVATVPSSDRLQRELGKIRGIGVPTARTGGQVNAHWKRPELVAAGATTDLPAAPKADRIRTERPEW